MSSRTIRAPRGAKLNCKSWHQEAALRCLMNNLDPDVAEKPDELIVYGGAGKAARNWASFDAIVRELANARKRRDAAGAVGQTGRRVSHARIRAPRADRQLQPRRRRGPTGNTFIELERKGLMMYGQMTAGSWIYIGTQGIVQGTFETFAAMADKHFGGDSKRQAHCVRRHGRHGRRAAAGGDPEWRTVSRYRRRSGAHRAARADTDTATGWR